MELECPPTPSSVMSENSEISCEETDPCFYITIDSSGLISNKSDPRVLRYIPDDVMQKVKEALMRVHKEDQQQKSGAKTKQSLQEMLEVADDVYSRGVSHLDVKDMRRFSPLLKKLCYYAPTEIETKKKIKVWLMRPDDWPDNVPHVDPNNASHCRTEQGDVQKEKPKRPELIKMMDFLLKKYWKVRPSLLKHVRGTQMVAKKNNQAGPKIKKQKVLEEAPMVNNSLPNDVELGNLYQVIQKKSAPQEHVNRKESAPKEQSSMPDTTDIVTFDTPDVDRFITTNNAMVHGMEVETCSGLNAGSPAEVLCQSGRVLTAAEAQGSMTTTILITQPAVQTTDQLLQEDACIQGSDIVTDEQSRSALEQQGSHHQHHQQPKASPSLKGAGVVVLGIGQNARQHQVITSSDLNTLWMGPGGQMEPTQAGSGETGTDPGGGRTQNLIGRRWKEGLDPTQAGSIETGTDPGGGGSQKGLGQAETWQNIPDKTDKLSKINTMLLTGQEGCGTSIFGAQRLFGQNPSPPAEPPHNTCDEYHIKRHQLKRGWSYLQVEQKPAPKKQAVIDSIASLGGKNTTAGGPSSTVIGPSSTVIGSSSTVIGPSSTVGGSTSTVGGPTSRIGVPDTNGGGEVDLLQKAMEQNNISSPQGNDGLRMNASDSSAQTLHATEGGNDLDLLDFNPIDLDQLSDKERDDISLCLSDPRIFDPPEPQAQGNLMGIGHAIPRPCDTNKETYLQLDEPQDPFAEESMQMDP